MGNNWREKPIFVSQDDVWVGDDAQDGHYAPDPLDNSSYWPSAPQHEPSNSSFNKPSGHNSYLKRHSPSVSQHEASRQAHDQGYDYSLYREGSHNSSTSHRPPMPSKNRAHHIEPPSQNEQEEAEETARDVLGPRFINYPTVQFILKLQATGMDPMEWVSVKDVITREPDAGKSLFLLAYLLHKDAKETEDEQAVLQAQEVSIREWWEAKKKLDPWSGL